MFEHETTSPLSIVLAIDESGTVMTSERLEKEAAKHFVRAILREQDELDLMDFADSVREIVPFTNQVKRIEQGLGALQQGDETALYNTVYLASQRLGQTSQQAGRRRVLVIISDGGDSIHGGEKYDEAIEEAQRANAMIYSIIIVPIASDAGRNTGGEHALIQMTEDTGGKYYYVEDPSDLEPAFRHVSDDLRTQYLLGYYASESAGNAFRQIKVRPHRSGDGARWLLAALPEQLFCRFKMRYFGTSCRSLTLRGSRTVLDLRVGLVAVFGVVDGNSCRAGAWVKNGDSVEGGEDGVWGRRGGMYHRGPSAARRRDAVLRITVFDASRGLGGGVWCCGRQFLPCWGLSQKRHWR